MNSVIKKRQFAKGNVVAPRGSKSAFSFSPNMKRAILKNKTNFKEYMQFKNALNDTVHEYNDIK